MTAFVLMIISAIFGAGFATGAELVAFFGASTLPPILISLIISVSMFTFMLVLIFACNHKLPNWIVRIISFVFLIAMIAGTTSLSNPIIAAASIAGCIMIIKLGFDNALKINKYVMSFALTIIFLVSFLHLGDSSHATHWKPSLPDITWTTWRALLYAGMNCFLLIAVFGASRKKYSTRQFVIASAVASTIIGFFAFVIMNAVYVNDVVRTVIPILQINGSFLVWLSIFVCIFTSMYIAMLGVVSSSKPSEKSDKSLGNSDISLFPLGIISISAFALSFLGFKKIIATFYPMIGIAMILYVSFISFWKLYSALKLHFSSRHIRVHQGQ